MIYFMGSKRAKRQKRQESFKSVDPTEVQRSLKQMDDPDEPPKIVKLPGFRFVQISGVLLMIAGGLSGVIAYYAMKNIGTYDEATFISVTSIAGQTPATYMTSIILTTFVGIFQFLFGYNAWKYANNGMKSVFCMVMGVVLLLMELAVQLYGLYTSNVITWTSVISGCALPIFLIFGSVWNLNYVKKHPDYKPPAAKPTIFDEQKENK
jgi:hypothetical protein